MILRLLRGAWAPFVAALCSRQDVESAGVLIAEPISDGHVLLVRELLLVPEEGYLVRRRDQLRIDPVALNRMVRPARDRGWSVFTVHTHPGTERAWFSVADDMGDSRLMPSLFVQSPAPHGSLVVAGLSGVPVGRAWSSPTDMPAPLSLRVVGPTLDVVIAPDDTDLTDLWFPRQRLALGPHGHRVLRDLRIGIVGLGGTGSVVAAQLAHLGVGHVTMIDGDRVEASNVSRIIGATCADAGMAWKVDVAAQYIIGVGLGTEVRALRGALGSGVPAAALADCDVIMSCVDAQTPRAILNRLAYDVGVPVIDLGSAFRIDPAGTVVETAGRVVVVGPERPCLACWGHLDPDRLRLEALSTSERSRLAAEGYLQGADVPAPSVVAFNTLVAGAAVIELLRLVTGFAGADDPPLRLNFDFRTGEVRRNRLLVSGACTICGHQRSADDPGLVQRVS